MSAIHVELIESEQAEKVLAQLGRAFEGQRLVLSLARLGMRQTKRRLETEKTAPDGTRWPMTKDGRGALFATGKNLAASIRAESSGTRSIWGTRWIGARVHQFGAVIVPVKAKALRFQVGGKVVFARRVKIPARPYLGISEANRTEIISVTKKLILESAE